MVRFSRCSSLGVTAPTGDLRSGSRADESNAAERFRHISMHSPWPPATAPAPPAHPLSAGTDIGFCRATSSHRSHADVNIAVHMRATETATVSHRYGVVSQRNGERVMNIPCKLL